MTGHRANRTDDRGLALVELALVLPLLALLVFGIFEFGFLWGDVNSVDRASQNAARTGSSLGDQRFADYEALRAVESTLAGLDGATPLRVITYLSTDVDGAVPQACLDVPAAGTSAKGVSGLCNVYSPQQIADDNPGNFGSSTPALTDCLSSAWDSAWCPTGRSRSLNDPDYLGVFVEAEYEGRTSIIPTSITVEQRAVYQIEPCKAGETTC